MANPLSILATAFKPMSYSLLEPGHPPQHSDNAPLPTDPAQTVSGPGFKWTLLIVFFGWAACAVAEMYLAGQWTTPTPNQQTAFTAMDWGFKSGFGGWLGLIGGKSLQ